MLRGTRRCASRPRSPPCSRGCTASYWLGETCSPSRCARPGGWSGSPTVTRGTGRNSQTRGEPSCGSASGRRRTCSRTAWRCTCWLWIRPAPAGLGRGVAGHAPGRDREACLAGDPRRAHAGAGALRAGRLAPGRARPGRAERPSRPRAATRLTTELRGSWMPAPGGESGQRWATPRRTAWGRGPEGTVAAVLCVAFARPRSGGVPIGFRGGVVTGSTAARLGSDALAAVLETLPDGVVGCDADWTIDYGNPAGAALVGPPPAELPGRSLWVAIPEASGTAFRSFLLHARSVGTPVTWQGFYAPAGRWLSATAVVVDDLLQVCLREARDRRPEPVGQTGGTEPAPVDAADDRDRLRYLAEVSEAMIATLDTGESATQLGELAVRRLCDWAVVALIGEDGSPGEEAWAHRDPARRADVDTYLRGRLRDTGDDIAVVEALLSGQPVQVNPTREELVAPSLPTEKVRAAWRRLETSSTTIVPLRARGETFGALAMMNAGARPPMTETEIATAVEVARRGGLALDNARLYGRQLKVAETLQRSLLTPPPQPDDLEIAVRYQPAAINMHVGGDWYDAFQQADGATLLVIGDVVGHNVDAAAAMGQIRSIVRGIAFDRQENPAAILGRVDEVMGGLRIGTMATALIARIEQTPEEQRQSIRRLRWSSAGHLPPLIRHADGTVDVMTTRPEPLLGADIPHARTDHVTRLLPDDTLLFYADGLVEQGRTTIDSGLERLVDAFRELGEA